jgi:flagellar L-ring protein precursor FlgH
MNIITTSRRAALAAALALATPAFAALPGLPAAPPEPTPDSIRPNENQEKPAVVPARGAFHGSLFKEAAMTPIPVGTDGQQIGGLTVSFTSVTPPKPKKFQKNDIITVIVALNSNSATTSQGNAQKKQDFDFAVQQFVQLATSASGVPTVGVVGEPSKLPEIKFKLDNNRQNQANQQRSDTLTDRFAAIVVDVKPNGTLVLEATQQVAMDKEILRYKMSGICRADAVTPDNTILSTQLANLNLSKQTSGEVREGVKRGWLNAFLDKWSPF